MQHVNELGTRAQVYACTDISDTLVCTHANASTLKQTQANASKRKQTQASASKQLQCLRRNQTWSRLEADRQL